MSGPVFAILSAFSFAANIIFVRRAVINVPNAGSGVFISVPFGAAFILIVLISRGEARSLVDFSWQSYFWLSAAGIVPFMVGRSLSYNCVQIVGANLATIIRKISLLVAVSLGITVLGEPVNWQLFPGVTFILFGVIVAGLNPQMFRSGQGLFSKIPRSRAVSELSITPEWPNNSSATSAIIGTATLLARANCMLRRLWRRCTP